ncbi:tandem-95 repeat protein [Xanthobacter sp. KR7-225]|uniref:tandem-95 repeat protein n=1 Tax=Xanthobacter sp. KR7-225 TaxID=3156613 RepID=UPI0032B4C4BF
MALFPFRFPGLGARAKTPAFGALDASKTVREAAANAGPVQLDPNVTLTNADGTGFGGGRLTVSIAGATAADSFSIAETGGITVSGDAVYYQGARIGTVTSDGAGGSALTVAFDSGPVSNQAASALARAVSYASSADAPGSAARAVTFQAVDAENTAGAGRINLKIAADRDAPVVSDLDAHVVRTPQEALTARVVDGDVTARNPDGTGFSRGSLSVHLDGATAGDDLTLAEGPFRIQGTKVYLGTAHVANVTSSGQDGADLTIKFKAAAKISDAQMTQLMEQVAHSTSDAAPPEGARTLTFTLTDKEGDVGRASVGLSVAQPNRAPAAADDVRTMAEDTPLVIPAAELLANDGDLDGDTLSVTGFGGASGGTLVYSGGTFTFTPDADYSGPASFTYTVSDGKGGADTATVAVTVTPVNDAPVATGDTATTAEDTPLVLTAAQLLANDADLDGNTLSVTGFGGASGGTLVYSGGTFTFTPDADYSGPASFTYTVSDGKGGTDTATVAVTVTPVNDAPVITSEAAATFAENGTGTAYQSAASDVEGDALTFSLSGADADLFTVDADGKVAFKAAPDFEAPADAGGDNVYDIVVEAHDGTATTSKAVAITVTDVAENSAPRLVEAPTPAALDVGALGQANRESGGYAVLSPDGTKVAFASTASNLAANDTNGREDVFVKDLVTGEVTLVSIASDGMAGGGSTSELTFSPDGSKVTFVSRDQLTPGDTNGEDDFYVTDLATGAVTLLISASDGTSGNFEYDRYNANYTYLPGSSKMLFEAEATNLVANDTNGRRDIFLKDLSTGETTLVSAAADGTPGNDSSYWRALTDDGTKVLFLSYASNLVAGDTNGSVDVFVKDLATGEVTMVSSAADGTPGNGESYDAKLSADETKVVFESRSSNLVAGDTNDAMDVFVKDLSTGAVTLVSSASDGVPGNASSDTHFDFSADATKVFFISEASNLVPDDTNNTRDLFVKDLVTGETRMLSSAADGTAGNGYTSYYTVSPDGTKVMFLSQASNLVAGDTNGNADEFVKDLATGAVTMVASASNGTPGIGYSNSFTFSPDGTKVLFMSEASNLVPDDTNGATDIFLKDLATGELTLISSASDGTLGNDYSGSFAFSPDGTKVVFWSYASNLVAGDTNDAMDVFAKDLATGTVTLLSSASDGTPGDGSSYYLGFTPDGTQVLISSEAGNLVPDDFNGAGDIFLKDIATGAVTRVSAPTPVPLTRTGSFTFSDADATDTHTVSIVPAAGALGTLQAVVVPVADGPDRVDWSYSVDPALIADLPRGESLSETFTVTVDDGHGGTVAVDVVVAVNRVNTAPEAFATGTHFLVEDFPLVLDVENRLGNDIDLDGDALTLAGVGDAIGGTVALEDGAITFTPDADFNGDASFTYTIADGHGGTDTETVSIYVVPVNDAPVAGDDAATTAEDTPLVLTAAQLLANDADVDGDTLSVTGFGGASGGTLVYSGGTFSFTPDADYSGPASFTYTVSDGKGGTDTATVAVDVTPVNDAPTQLALSNDQIAENLAGATIGTLSASDPDSTDTLTYSIVPELDGALFTISGNELRVGQAGLDYEVSATRSVTVRATDSKGAYTEETITIDVLDRPETVLTTGPDVFEGTAADEQVFANYNTLNPEDRLSGGDGYDILFVSASLDTLDLSTPTTFSGFEEVRLGGFWGGLRLRDGTDLRVVSTSTSWGNSFYLSTGRENISGGADSEYFEADRVAELSDGDVLDGAGGSDSLQLSGGGTFDLTPPDLRNIEVLYIQSSTTARVDDDALADFRQVYGSTGSLLVTGADSLDLSGKTLSGVAVTSDNTSGTVFTIDRPANSFLIQGGPGNDTLVADGFTYTDEQRALIFATTSIETIQDSSGTYVQSTPAPWSSTLTTASDVVTAYVANQTVYGTAETLSPGDALAAGEGHDTLVLAGRGTFDLSTLAEFSGFEEVQLVNDFDSSYSILILRDGVDLTVTGGAHFTSFYLSTGAEKIFGGNGGNSFYTTTPADLTLNDELHGGTGSDTLYLRGDAVTYDLRGMQIEGIETLGIQSGTVIVDSDVLTDVTFIESYDGGTLSTPDAELDLRGVEMSSVFSYVPIQSINATGTTFIVDDADTARFVRGGTGIDTLVASGLGLTEYERQSIFTNGSVEIIRDSTGIYGDETANALVGTAASEIISGGGGADVLTGGAGADTFVLATQAGARITFFDAGGQPDAGDDILDIGALVSASSFVAGDDLSDFVWFEDADGDAGTAGAYVMYDADGAGAGAVVQHTQLDGPNVGDTLYLAYGGTTATDLIIL